MQEGPRRMKGHNWEGYVTSVLDMWRCTICGRKFSHRGKPLPDQLVWDMSKRKYAMTCEEAIVQQVFEQ